MFVVVSYDVNEKRIAEVNKFLSRFLVHVQLSVFEGELGRREIAHMLEGLQRVIDPEEDSVRIYVFESSGCVRRIVLGSREEEGPVI